jgi:hypothetical protein
LQKKTKKTKKALYVLRKKHDPNSYTTQQDKGNQHKDTKAPSVKTQNRSHHSATGQNKQDTDNQNTSYH